MPQNYQEIPSWRFPVLNRALDGENLTSMLRSKAMGDFLNSLCQKDLRYARYISLKGGI